MISLLRLTHKQLLAIAAILGVIGTGFFYIKYRQAKMQNTTEIASIEKQKLLDKIGKFIELPADEDPTIATVTDVERLKNQPFFAKAKNGDKVIIYTNAKKAILYDSIAGKIVEYAPLNIGADTASPAATVTNVTPTTSLSSTVTPKPKASPTPTVEPTAPVPS